MDVKQKVIDALSSEFPVDYIRLEDDDGISGFVVSQQFKDMSMLDRQELIDHALHVGPRKLTPQENRQILMIAGVTPLEYDTVGARIRIHRIQESPPGVKILLQGGSSDAKYVQQALFSQPGLEASEPHQEPGAIGVLMSFFASRSTGSPLTKAEAIQLLESDPYIQVMPNA